jgi:membrane fusion protein (multidrug efflux system)
MVPDHWSGPDTWSGRRPAGDTIVNFWRILTGHIQPHRAGSVLAVAGILLSGCEDASNQNPAAAPPPPAVSVVELMPQDVTPSAQFVGRVIAIDTVDLRARVAGFLERGSSSLPRALFREGAEVKKGDLLYLIEQPPFEAEVAVAKAQVAQAEANLAEANATLERVQEAVKSGAVSRQELDQATAAAQEGQAQVLAAKAQLQIAEINLGYTEVYAPIDGRIGRTAFTFGNLVGPDSGVLATIVSQDPIYVTFPVSTRIILDARKRAAETGQPAEFVVRAQLPDGTMYDRPGKVNFLDIRADQTTDTITVRAEFPNPEQLLVDGQFVNVTVEREKPKLRLAIPQSALQVDQAGSYVLVVNGQDQVEQRRIQTGQAFEGNLVVQSGLEAGDRVIVEGIQKVRPGEKVEVSALPAKSAQPGAAAPGTPSPAPEPGQPGSAAAETGPQKEEAAAPAAATPKADQ